MSDRENRKESPFNEQLQNFEILHPPDEESNQKDINWCSIKSIFSPNVGNQLNSQFSISG